MAEFFQLLVSGLATGAIYTLAALGFTLIWQTSQTINFAQGEFVMVPAFFVLAAGKLFGLSFPLAIVVGIALSVVVLGVLFKRVVVDPMLPHGVLPLVISTIALSILLKESVKEFFSAQAEPFPTVWPSHDFHLWGAVVSTQNLIILGIAICMVAGLHLFLHHTKVGRCMQATAQNRVVAQILGIKIQRMVLYTFIINAILVGVASVLITPIYLAKFTNGEALGLAAFIAAIIGGFNQVRGAIVGGLILGVVENFSAAYISAQYRAAFPMILLILVILFLPQGLMGRKEERTV